MKNDNPLMRILKEYPAAVICFIIALVCGGLIFMRGDVASELSVKEEDLHKRMRIISKNSKNAKDLKAEIDEIKLLVDQIDARLFNRDQRAVNINFFYDLENRFKVQMSTVSQVQDPDATFAKGGARELKLYSTIAYSIALSGSFEDILSFLYELYRVDAVVRISNCHISAGSSKTEGDDLVARLRILVLAENE